MAQKEFTKLERIGMVVIVIVAMTFVYHKVFYGSASKRYKSVHRERGKVSREVEDLKLKLAGGRVEREIRRLNTRLRKEKEKLGEAELKLAESGDISELSSVIIRLASKYGLVVRDFNPVKERMKSRKNKDSFYERKFYTLSLNSDFTRLKLFLEELSVLPKLVTVEKIDMKKEDRGQSLKTTLILAFDLGVVTE